MSFTIDVVSFIVDLLWDKKAMNAGLPPTHSTSNSIMNEPIEPLRGVGIALEIKGASFAWDTELKAEDLHRVNFRADAGIVTFI